MSRFKFICLLASASGLLLSQPGRVMARKASLLTFLSLQQSNSSGFVIFQSLPVAFGPSGENGSLQILQDQRVTPRYRQSWGASANPAFTLGPDDPLVKSIQAAPLKNGRIRLVAKSGRVIAVAAFDEPLAEIETTHLYGTSFPTYLVSIDYGIGMGSYAGPATTLVEVHQGKLLELPINLAQSLKNGWKIVPSSHGPGQDIETVQCHPDEKSLKTVNFVVDYSTYRFEHGYWRRYTRENSGFWEADEGWPARTLFP